MRKRIVAVIGGGTCTRREARLAEEVGRLLAKAGAVVLTGGLGGVMQAASRGASRGGGLVMGVIPGDRASQANPHVEIAIATAMGDARNAIIANTAEAFVAVGGGFGTLSEIAFALKRRKRVVGLATWGIPGVVRAASPADAVKRALRR